MTLLQTRSQKDLKQAIENIKPLANESEALKKNYLTRVKQLSALVMTVGLAQALAFSQEKCTRDGDLGTSHRHLLTHVASVLNVPNALTAVQASNASEYMQMTRRVLAAWVYYRRFAVSILDPNDTIQEEGGN